MPRFKKLASYANPQDLADYAAGLGIGISLPLPSQPVQTTMAEGWSFEDASVGRIGVDNRFTILPMEGWDAGLDGTPTERVRRRWLRFAASGAKLLWFEATAVCYDGRANARQLIINPDLVSAFAELRQDVLSCHHDKYGSIDGLVTGLQLTHSGRWCRPEGKPIPRIVYRHPFLDRRAGVVDDSALMSDADIDRLIEDFIDAAVCVRDTGFDFVDIKHCHGYFAHELLSAYQRPGRYGGCLENRGRFLREVINGIRERCPELAIAVRLSAYDFQPFRADHEGIGEPETEGEYPYAFGGAGSGLEIDWNEIAEFIEYIASLGVGLVCITAGSPYYTPHIQRPAFYPPSDGYQPPEDPVLGVARLLDLTRRVKQSFPKLGIVGTGFTYLQQHLPELAAACIENSWMDSVGLGRMGLSYPTLPDDVLHARKLARKTICRTFSDCTTAPRNGLVSGCYPLDDAYRHSEEYERLRVIKRGQ